MVVDILGWIGSFLIIVAYAVTVKTKSRYLKLCNYLNLIGAILVGYNCYVYQAFPSLLINIFWVAIATFGIVESFKEKNSKK
ncbi:CBU_0592 family membrane protein [Polaribacter cellanae]|uniref:CBU-0592-like domain-containing protein n=1 Tax=Polaribacter cellanae TaxID=2818493 RepID=A0A975CRE2_9FLAO|nr:hypothetical protein [Polaribacter cellanae]QTE24308.1 hypothetical protein J3359_08625 [Polaribacter cellanae]